MILCVNHKFSKSGFQYIDQVFMTECFFCPVQNCRISQPGILEKQFAKGGQKAILIMCYTNYYEYVKVVYIDFASVKLQLHKRVKFRNRNIISGYLGVFEQRGRYSGARRSYSADTYEAYLCYF